MSTTRYPAIIFLSVVIVSITLPMFYYSHLPDTVASHFNINNAADGWMSKKSFLIIQLATTVVLSGMFLLITYFTPKLPNSIINLPNKEYWLNEERREESLKIFQRFIYWFGSLTLGFLTLIFQEVYLVNLQGKGKLSSSIWIYLIVFLAVLTFILIKMIMYFNKTNNKGEIIK